MVDPSAIATAFLKTYTEMMATGSAATVANLYVSLNCPAAEAVVRCLSGHHSTVVVVVAFASQVRARLTLFRMARVG